ncbi:MAG: hypothetical protein LBT40_13745 [Deltaproteobacteria bacterium]|jgi:hypothetical protein|nr:hypothetical protein [Deltaproteobacteria bacterium]
MAGRDDEALPYLAEAVSVSTRLPGPEQDRTLGRRISMGMATVLSGRAGEGLARLMEAGASRVELLGGEDPRTLSARTDVGIALDRRGWHERAVAVFRDVLAVVERLGPEEGGMVPMARANLRLAEVRLGERGLPQAFCPAWAPAFAGPERRL